MSTIPTSISRGLSASELQACRDHYDRACKRLLSEKSVLGWILHECLDEFGSVDPQQIASTYIEGDPEVSTTPVHADDAAAMITGLNAEDSSLAEGTVWYDIRFSAVIPDTSERVGMIVNVEAQGDAEVGYPLLKRAAYYCGRMLSAQYGRIFAGSHYEKLQKVCSIWVCPNPPTSLRNTITRYRTTEHNIVGEATRPRSEYDMAETVLVCPDGDHQDKGDGLLRLLGALLVAGRSIEERKSIIAEEFGIPMTQQLNEGVSDVGSGMSSFIERRGYERGMEQGREKGLELGLEQGLAQGLEQGLEQGARRRTEQLARLAAALKEQGRDAQLTDALLDANLLEQLFAEFELDE